MISKDGFSSKHLVIWLLVVCGGITTLYIIFWGIISIRFGLKNIYHDGFWVPILTGAIVMTCSIWIFFRLSKYLLKQLKEEDFMSLK